MADTEVFLRTPPKEALIGTGNANQNVLCPEPKRENRVGKVVPVDHQSRGSGQSDEFSNNQGRYGRWILQENKLISENQSCVLDDPPEQEHNQFAELEESPPQRFAVPRAAVIKERPTRSPIDCGRCGQGIRVNQTNSKFLQNRNAQ